MVMAAKKPSQSFKVGDRVKIRYWPDLRACIVEERGALGPGGTLVFRIRISGKPKPSYVEVREDQLIAIPATPNGERAPSAKRRTAGDEARGQ
jgi:hypothetical protein